MKEIYGLLVVRIQKFQTTKLKQHKFEFLSGFRLSFLITNSHWSREGLKKLSTQDFILITSIEIAESKFLKHGCLPSNSATELISYKAESAP